MWQRTSGYYGLVGTNRSKEVNSVDIARVLELSVLMPKLYSAYNALNGFGDSLFQGVIKMRRIVLDRLSQA